MARGTDFGGIHSSTDLHLIQQSVDVQPAEPKLNIVDVPGADGGKDFTKQPAGRVVYNDRKLTWIFALYPGEVWGAKRREVSNALNGRRCQITLDSDPDYYFDGRLSVKKYNVDKTLRQITVEAICRPYMMKQQETVVRGSMAQDHSVRTLMLRNERKYVVPTITLDVAAIVSFGAADYALPAGTHKLLDIELQPGTNELRARTADAVTTSGTITVTYREGSL